MPLVIVSRREMKFRNALLRPIIKALPAVIAQALTVQGTDGELSSKDVEIWTRDIRNDDLDTEHGYDIQVVIFANKYPERAENLGDRRVLIANWLQDRCPEGVVGSVWILLQEPTSFGTFVASK